MALDLNTNRAMLGNFQRNYLYMLTISRKPDSLSDAMAKTIGDGVNIDVYNETITNPDHKTNEINMMWVGQKFIIPGVEESAKVGEFSFYDDENQKLYGFFKECKKLTGTQKNNANLGGDGPSGLDFNIIKYSSDKKTMMGNSKRLINCKVYAVTPDPLAKTNNGVSKYKVRIAWDEVEDFDPNPSSIAVN